MPKTENDFLNDVKNAISRVVATPEPSMESLLKKDLGISSLDFIDILFELESITGIDTRASKLILESTSGSNPGFDIQIGRLVQYLVQNQTRR